VKAKVSFDGSMDDLKEAYIQLLRTLFDNKTLSQNDLYELVARSRGLRIDF